MSKWEAQAHGKNSPFKDPTADKKPPRAAALEKAWVRRTEKQSLAMAQRTAEKQKRKRRAFHKQESALWG